MLRKENKNVSVCKKDFRIPYYVVPAILRFLKFIK